MVKITSEPIQIAGLIPLVSSPQAGALDVFLGVTRSESQGREVLYLEYETYEKMALREMRRLETEACEKFKLLGCVMLHRIGRVDIGEVSVAIAVSSAHRHETFTACRFLIDQLKKTVPIWKREFFADGRVAWSGESPLKREEQIR